MRFSGHETFVFRYPWPAKGVRGVAKDPLLFGREESIVTLGVGRNMVRSIRHWCECLRLIEPLPKGRMGLQPTTLGLALFGSSDDEEVGAGSDSGLDPYLEDIGTLWLLHYLLASQAGGASTWHMVFSKFSKAQFQKNELLAWLLTQAELANSRVNANTLERDLQVFLRTYLPARHTRDSFSEDSFDCPLVELGLMEDQGNATYAILRLRRPTLPAGIFTFALLDYWQRVAAQEEMLTFERLLYGPGSPGAAFRLTENELTERLEQLDPSLGLQLSSTAGLRGLYGSPDLTEPTRLKLLRDYYARVFGERHV